MNTHKSLSLLCCAILMAGCSKTADPISGIYVQHFKNAYSIATDTLVIEPYNPAAGIYKLERRDGYHRIREGKVLPKEFRSESWMATFDMQKQLLQESGWGRQVFINTANQTAAYNGLYRKIR